MMEVIKLNLNLLDLLRERSFSLIVLNQLLAQHNLLSQHGKEGMNRTLLIMGQDVTLTCQRLKKILW
ncbi:unnamed protein product [Meloidogyne enterolobii]|uniref:Uncharacterized protein n=1 Tax=Meloidogyne enterolobii TaxID=390850 RepID=A0ACB0ZZ12_MELEN